MAKAEKKVEIPAGLIKITKFREPDLYIHQDALAEHEKLGWKPVETVAEATEDSKE